MRGNIQSVIAHELWIIVHKNNVSVCVDPDLTYNEHEENYRAYFIRALLPVILTINQMHWRGDILPSSVCKHYLLVDIYLPRYFEGFEWYVLLQFGHTTFKIGSVILGKISSLKKPSTKMKHVIKDFQNLRIKTILGHVTKITAPCVKRQPVMVIKSHKKNPSSKLGDLPNTIAIVFVQNDDGFFCSQACKKFSCPLTLAVK